MRRMNLPNDEELQSMELEALVANKKNIEKELPIYEEGIQHRSRIVEINKKRIELKKKMSAISDKKNKALNPGFEFQEDPEWIILHSQYLSMESENEVENMLREIDKLKREIGPLQEELDRFKEFLPRLKKVIADKGG